MRGARLDRGTSRSHRLHAAGDLLGRLLARRALAFLGCRAAAWSSATASGEIAAACVAGAFSLETGLHLVAERGRLMEQAPAGSMYSFPAEEQQIAGGDPALRSAGHRRRPQRPHQHRHLRSDRRRRGRGQRAGGQGRLKGKRHQRRAGLPLGADGPHRRALRLFREPARDLQPGHGPHLDGDRRAGRRGAARPAPLGAQPPRAVRFGAALQTARRARLQRLRRARTARHRWSAWASRGSTAGEPGCRR